MYGHSTCCISWGETEHNVSHSAFIDWKMCSCLWQMWVVVPDTLHSFADFCIFRLSDHLICCPCSHQKEVVSIFKWNLFVPSRPFLMEIESLNNNLMLNMKTFNIVWVFKFKNKINKSIEERMNWNEIRVNNVCLLFSVSVYYWSSKLVYSLIIYLTLWWLVVVVTPIGSVFYLIYNHVNQLLHTWYTYAFTSVSEGNYNYSFWKT